jgi:hypothetical protein
MPSNVAGSNADQLVAQDTDTVRRSIKLMSKLSTTMFLHIVNTSLMKSYQDWEMVSIKNLELV